MQQDFAEKNEIKINKQLYNFKNLMKQNIFILRVKLSLSLKRQTKIKYIISAKYNEARLSSSF